MAAVSARRSSSTPGAVQADVPTRHEGIGVSVVAAAAPGSLGSIDKDLAQVEERFGAGRARTIANSHQAKVILPGVTDRDLLGTGVAAARRGTHPDPLRVEPRVGVGAELVRAGDVPAADHD
jgi:hypothetical protein